MFDEILGGRLMSDPSFLVTSPTASDPSLAPAGRSSYYVLFPTPNLDGPVDWRVERAALPRVGGADGGGARLAGASAPASRCRT